MEELAGKRGEEEMRLFIIIMLLIITGIYVLMFVHIFYTFCKAIILTVLLIFAFSFAFYMAFYDPSENFLVGVFSSKESCLSLI